MMRLRYPVLIALFATLAAAGPVLAVDEGEKVFQDVCLQCHTPEQRPLTDKHMTREQWRERVDTMMALGADVPTKKIEPLLDYLVRTHGPLGADQPASR